MKGENHWRRPTAASGVAGGHPCRRQKQGGLWVAGGHLLPKAEAGPKALHEAVRPMGGRRPPPAEGRGRAEGPA